MISFKNNPVKAVKITSKFGPRNYGGYQYHSGIDLAPDKTSTTPEYLFAVNDGTVKIAKADSSSLRGGYGNYVVIEHADFCTLYAHMDSYKVVVGQKVKAGEIIGVMGNTGDSTGTHLHFEVRSCLYDTSFWKKGSIAGQALLSVDPEKYLLAENKTSSNTKTEVTPKPQPISPAATPAKVHWAQSYLDKLVAIGIISNPETWNDFDNPPTKAMVIALAEKILSSLENK